MTGNPYAASWGRAPVQPAGSSYVPQVPSGATIQGGPTAAGQTYPGMGAYGGPTYPGMTPTWPGMPSAAGAPGYTGMQPGGMQAGGMQATGGMPGMAPGFAADEESYIENILRLNLGKRATIYMTFENNEQWNAKVFTGILEAAGRDHIIISNPETGQRFLLLMVNLDYIVFDEELNYAYPFRATT